MIYLIYNVKNNLLLMINLNGKEIIMKVKMEYSIMLKLDNFLEILKMNCHFCKVKVNL